MNTFHLFRAAGIGIIIAIWVLSLIPIDQSVVPGSSHSHHFIAYFVCMYVWGQAYRRPVTRLWFVIAFSLMGALIECAQGLTSYRHFSFMDMAVDAVAVIAGWLTVTVQLAIQRRSTRTPNHHS